VGDATREVAKLYPPPPPGRFAAAPYDVTHLVPIKLALTTITRPMFGPIFLTAAALMLLACVNLAGLASARMQDRQHELALRRALGASRGDLLRLTGIESAMAIFTGAGLGLLLATLLLGVVRALMPAYVLFKTPAIDARVIGFAGLASTLSVVVVTLWPARSTRGASLRPSLAEAGTSRRRSGGRTLLVAAQVALALVLVLGGTLFVVSLSHVWQEDAGVRTDHAFRLELTTRGAPQDVATINSVIDTVRRVPGVVGAGGLDHPFLQQMFNGSVFDAPLGINDRGIESLPVTAGFLQAAGLSAIDGRLPTDAELEAGAPVIAVSLRAAQRYWPGQPAVGQTLTMKGRPFIVVGVVPEVRFRSLDAEPEGEVYWPVAAQAQPHLWNLYVRVDPSADDAVAAILQGLAARFPVYQVLNVQTAAGSYGEAIRGRRFQAWLFGSFAIAALVIVGVGILGLLAMTTARRTREIGIRIALGATRDRIIHLLLGEQLVSVALGLGSGGLASVWAVRFVQASLYHMTGYDTQVWAVAVAVIVLTAVAGTLLPALRASRTDPMKALRVD
jgi:putative ABC transport system permease protein